MTDHNKREHYTGCLLGGAVGDALGWPVEFSEWDEIVEEYGAAGIREMVPGEAGLFEITDDTQMTLFTAEGLLRAWTAARRDGTVPDFREGLMASYRCWLMTQGEEGQAGTKAGQHGWLLAEARLHRRRAPGSTCLSALEYGHVADNGIVDNDSKGCGGVMRAAPAGLLAARINRGDSIGTALLAFELGCMAAAQTHGNPSGYCPAGVLAAIIATIICGGSIEEGAGVALGILDGRSGSQETADAVESALGMWHHRVLPSPEAIEVLGGGWTGEEALAIGLYCALSAGDDLERGVRMAVNHAGDSDSTGSITGNILGALLGERAIPNAWLARLELADVIRQVGDDLFTAFEENEEWLRRYPPLLPLPQ